MSHRIDAIRCFFNYIVRGIKRAEKGKIGNHIPPELIGFLTKNNWTGEWYFFENRALGE